MSVVCLDQHASHQTRLRADDVRVDTFRASGAGGQHRNKTDSGVRLTHLPTGTVVTATEDRSQHRNRAVAWERLRERLAADQEATAHRELNRARQDGIGQPRAWTWTAWRDEVKGPEGQRASMRHALTGNLSGLLA